MSDAHDESRDDTPSESSNPFDHITPDSTNTSLADASAGPPSGEPAHPMQVRIHLPERRPIVSYTLIGITVLVFLAQMASNNLLGGDYPAALGMKINDFIQAGQYWRFITPVLLHGNILHIGVNMYSLYVIGPGLERHYGHWQFLLLYVVCGITGVAASVIFSDANSLGASTAIFGLLGAYGALLFQNRRIFSGARAALNQVLRVAALNLLLGLAPGIDNWGHMGGLLGGVIVGLIGGPIYAVVRGEIPGIHLENQRPQSLLLVAGIAVAAVFVAAALFLI